MIILLLPKYQLEMTQNAIIENRFKRLIGFIQQDGNIELIILSPEIISYLLFRDICPLYLRGDNSASIVFREMLSYCI